MGRNIINRRSLTEDTLKDLRFFSCAAVLSAEALALSNVLKPPADVEKELQLYRMQQSVIYELCIHIRLSYSNIILIFLHRGTDFEQ